MIRLDKIDIVCPFNPETMDVSCFGTTTTNNDEVVNSVFPIESRWKNDIRVVYNRQRYEQDRGKAELKVCITSKVLGEDYISKISISNIERCLHTVLDNTSKNLFLPREIIDKGTTSHVHVTEDVAMSVTKDECKVLDSLLIKPRNWNYDDRHRNSYGWNSRLAIEKGRHSFKLYNKENQMNNSKRKRKFMSDLEIPSDTFDGLLRLELKLKTPALIRKGFAIETNRVLSVLTSETHPITNFIKTNFDLSERLDTSELIKSMGDYEMRAVIEKHGFDWQSIEREIRRYTTTNASKRIEPYRRMYQSLLSIKNKDSKGLDLLNQMISLVDDIPVLTQAA